jgi:MYXO-CTERM domain-containing protein
MVLAKLAPLALAAFLSFGDPFTFDYSGQTGPGGQVTLVVRANQDLDDVVVTIKGDGKTINKKLGRMKNGKSHKITWTQGSGQAKYDLEVTGQGVEAVFAFEVVKPRTGEGKLEKLKVRSTREDVIKRRQATFQTSFPLVNYEYKIYDADGDVIDSDLVAEPVKAGESFTIKWKAKTEVFMIWVKGEDNFGRFTEYKLVPWAVEIPHTEINFDTDKHDVKKDEAAKLDEALAVAFHELEALDRVNKAVNAQLTPRLYIVGFTDTVGNAAYNEKLSRSRARAIAEYFRDHGFWAAIYYNGMGERGLRVETGDNVDEVRNRRALYLIGVQDPAPGGQIPARWTRLVGARQRPAGFQLPPLPERWANYRAERMRGQDDGEAAADREDELPSGDGGGGGDDGAAVGDGSTEDLDYGDDGGPPPVEGEPGASGKGCRVGGDPGPAIGLLVLFALAGTRRRQSFPTRR